MSVSGEQLCLLSCNCVTAYLFGVASEATKKVSSTVNETATTLKKTVEEKVGAVAPTNI